MPGYGQVTKSLEGRYVELTSRGTGKIWRGKIRKVTIIEYTGKDPTRRIRFQDGRELIAHEGFQFTIKFMEK